MPNFTNSKTLKMISQVRSFPYPDKQGTPEEGWRIQLPKHCITTTYNEDEDNSLKNQIQNIVHQPTSKNIHTDNYNYKYSYLPKN